MDPGDPLSRQVLLVDNDWSTYLHLYGPYVAVVLTLLLLAGFVSAAEAAFFSLSPDDRALCRDSLQPADQRIARLLERPKRLLASLVIFNNLLNIALVIIVLVVSWQISQSAHEVGWLLMGVTLVTTLAIVLFGEIIPKAYANQHHLAVARQTARLAQVGLFVFRPLSVLLVNLSNQLDKRVQRRGYKLSVEELNQAVELTGHGATTEEKDMLKGIVNFSNLTARQVMRARMDITAFADELTFSQLLAQINASGYSRVPVYTESIDQSEAFCIAKTYYRTFMPMMALLGRPCYGQYFSFLKPRKLTIYSRIFNVGEYIWLL